LEARLLKAAGLSICAAFMLAIAVSAASAGGQHHGVTPLLRFGPLATLAPSRSALGGPQYLLFVCQVGSVPFNCYDPYQMRTAYGTDTLIKAGYTGRGQTIVIVDAFQSPNIVQQQNVFNSFYGLPSLNGLAPSSIAC